MREQETLDKLMREQKEHDEVCNYLFEVLKEKRASHPSFTLLGNDDIDRRLFPEIEESKDRVLMPAMGEKDGASAPIWDLIEEEQKEGFRHIVIEGTGGARKMRIQLNDNRGKSGGGRVIYVDIFEKEKIYLLFAYPKNVQENLTAEQKKAIKKIIDEIRKE